jgi:hypothetical protein
MTMKAESSPPLHAIKFMTVRLVAISYQLPPDQASGEKRLQRELCLR